MKSILVSPNTRRSEISVQSMYLGLMRMVLTKTGS